jgi:mutator protein MutT
VTAPIDVAAGILRHGPAVLVCQRRAGTRHAGKWEFPGGKREPGETIEACLRRELAEELGIEVEVGPRLWQTRHQYAGGPVLLLHFFPVRIVGGTLVNREFAAIRWVPTGLLATVDFLEADRAIVEQLDRGALGLDPAGGERVRPE